MASSSQLLAAFCIMVTILDLAPLVWQFPKRNVAVITLSIWLAQGSLFTGLNLLLWEHNVVDRAPVYCDITLALRNALSFAMLTCPLCIARQLESIASPRYETNSRRHEITFELVFCVVLPCLYEGLSIVVQPNRYYIVEDFGCTVPIYFALPAIFLNYVPVIVFALVVCGYSGTALFWFFRRRAQFSDVLSLSHSGLSVARFLRLVCILTVFALGSLVFALFHVIDATVLTGVQPWVSWDYVHGGFDKIFVYPLSSLSADNIRELWATTLHVPIYGFLYFLFFGVSGDAFTFYRAQWGNTQRLLSRIRNAPPTKGPVKPPPVERDPESFDDLPPTRF